MSHSYQITILITAFFFYTTFSLSHLCSDQCSSMKYFNCKICYQTCQLPVEPTPPNNTVSYSLKFQSCRERFCSKWITHRYNQGNETRQQTYCAVYDWLQHNEYECIQECCNHPSYNQFTNLTFAQCLTANQQLHQTKRKVGMILMIVFGGIFLVVVCIILFCVFREKCKDIQIFKGK